MARGKAEDAGGLTPAKDDNAAPYHFDPRTLPIFKCVDYIGMLPQFSRDAVLPQAHPSAGAAAIWPKRLRTGYISRLAKALRLPSPRVPARYS